MSFTFLKLFSLVFVPFGKRVGVNFASRYTYLEVMEWNTVSSNFGGEKSTADDNQEETVQAGTDDEQRSPGKKNKMWV